MVSYLIMSRTQSQAYRIANLAARSGYYAKIIRPPAEISSGDCSYAVKVPERQLADVLAMLNRNGIERGKVYLYRADGTTEENYEL
ncbi:MAG: DUF3343 domain-containing protein [Oscillospiraceae bacterium]|jgi:hypothetical protein|nr:DUF3343 domain-containing protein [Oscillospiraceae bacterium]